MNWHFEFLFCKTFCKLKSVLKVIMSASFAFKNVNIKTNSFTTKNNFKPAITQSRTF